MGEDLCFAWLEVEAENAGRRLLNGPLPSELHLSVGRPKNRLLAAGFPHMTLRLASVAEDATVTPGIEISTAQSRIEQAPTTVEAQLTQEEAEVEVGQAQDLSSGPTKPSTTPRTSTVEER